MGIACKYLSLCRCYFVLLKMGNIAISVSGNSVKSEVITPKTVSRYNQEKKVVISLMLVTKKLEFTDKEVY